MPEANQTEQATPRHRQRAREKGQVARSRDLIGAASGMAATFVLFSMMSTFPLAWRAFFHDCLDGAVSGSLRMDTLPPILNHFALLLPIIVALGVGWIVALSSALAQGGLVFAPSSLMPTFSRMSPAAKLSQLFSITALRGLIKSLLPATAVTYIAIGCLRRDWPLLMSLLLVLQEARWVLPPAESSKWHGNQRWFYSSGPSLTISSNVNIYRANCE